MEGQLVHFELPAADAGRAKEFWKSLFGWKFREWSGPVEYHMLDGIEPGGAIYPSDDGAGSGRSSTSPPRTSTPRSPGHASSAAPRRTSSPSRRSAGSPAAVDTEGNASRSSSPTSRCRRRPRARPRATGPARRAPARGQGRGVLGEPLGLVTMFNDPSPAASPPCTGRPPLQPPLPARARRAPVRHPERPCRWSRVSSSDPCSVRVASTTRTAIAASLSSSGLASASAG